ncbi:MAG: hypothetical protein ACTHXA_10730 [Gulosibacter sp.]|uniref:hypothetical protein n=1 Tax=Gulosibacter sp. TaxID=2817531 RepID=UPI003F917C3B
MTAARRAIALSTDERVNLAIWRGTKQYAPIVLQAIATVGIGFVPGGFAQSSPYSEWAWPLLIASILAALAGGIWGVRQRRSTAELERHAAGAHERAEARADAVRRALDHIVQEIMDDLRVNRAETRGSVYRHRNDDFLLVSRWSENPKLHKIGTLEFSDDQGVLAEAWERGFASTQDMDEDLEKWRIMQEEQYNVSRDRVLKLTMHARSMLALRIDHNGDQLGAIVLESRRPRGLTTRHLAQLKEHILVRAIAPLLSIPWSHLPSAATLSTEDLGNPGVETSLSRE